MASAAGAQLQHAQAKESGAAASTVAFEAQLNNAKVVWALLSGIYSGRKDQHAKVIVNYNGLRVSIENQAKSLHAVAYLKAGIFNMFGYYLEQQGMQAADDDEDVDTGPAALEFRVNVASVIECLTVFGAAGISNTSLHMSYENETAVFRLLLEEDGVLTQCEVRTLQTDDEELDFPGAFRETKTLNRILISAEAFREALVELFDLPGASTVSVLVSPQVPHFRLAALGTVGTCEVEFPKGSESFLSFESEATQEFHYHLPLLQAAARVLPHAATTYLRLNESGMLSMNHKIANEADDSTSYVSFILLPDDDDDEEEEEEDDEGVEDDVPAMRPAHAASSAAAGSQMQR